MITSEVKVKYLNRIEKLLKELEDTEKMGLLGYQETVDACYFGVLGIMETLYGKTSPQIKELSEFRKTAAKPPRKKHISIFDVNEIRITDFAQSLRGCLRNIQEELEGEFIGKLTEQISGEVIGDFVTLAKVELKGGFKDVAAVIACAALEDAMKRKAESVGLNVEGKPLTTVINSLKSKSVLKGSQASIVSSDTKLRNSAMHADWKNISETDVSSLIGFLEPFLLEHFK